MKPYDYENNRLDEKMRAYLMDIERLPCGIAIIKNDQYATLIRANPTFYKIIGHTEEELLENYENHMNDVLVDDFSDVVQQQATETDYNIEWDIRMRRADGKINWIHDVAHYDAELNAFYVIFVDITDKMIQPTRHLSYDAFYTRNEILGYVNQYSTEHITVTDAETDEVIYMNSSAIDLLGFQNEADWLGKSYAEVGFGSVDNVHPSYYQPLSENEFTSREYYNKFHKMYVHAESKIIEVPALNRKMRLNILTNITAQTQLEHQIALQKALHDCVDSMFTAAATDKVVENAYYDILYQLKGYYQSDGAFFYKFRRGTHEVECVYKVLSDGKEKTNQNFHMTVSDEQIKLMKAVSVAKPSDTQNIKDVFGELYQSTLKQLRLDYKLDNFFCVAINNTEGDIVAFMGVSNPRYNEDEKELMEVLSRFICMFIEHEQDDIYKEEALKLEAASKTKVVEMCAKNLQNITHSKENITNTLDVLCGHYDADFAIIISRDENGKYDLSHTGGHTVPDLSGLRKSSHFMGGWLETFKKHTHFASDLDFDDVKAPIIKKLLRDKFGIYNFVASPMRGNNGDLAGLLIVSNLNLNNRSRLLVHIVAKDIFDYLERISMHKKVQLEPATKLSNKIATQTQISKLLEAEEKGALFVIDIDNFKQLNDTFGHQVGDQAIIDLAAVLKRLFRSTDVIGRVGGDEFMVFSPGLSASDLITEKANQMVKNGHLRYEKDGTTVEISVSVGICCVDEERNTFQTLYAKADYALYTSKRNGKNQFHIYTPSEQDSENLDDYKKKKVEKKKPWWQRFIMR